MKLIKTENGWQCRVYWYDSDGKRHSKQVSADTKRECQDKAEQLRGAQNSVQQVTDKGPPVTEIVERYLECKEPVWSPSTSRENWRAYRNYIDGTELGRMPLLEVETYHVQLWISELASVVSPKTIRNAAGVLRPALLMFRPSMTLNLTFPAKKKHETEIPTRDEIKSILEAISGSELEIAVRLGILMLRRSEICGLQSSDLNGNVLHIHRSMVEDKNGEYVVKPEPKNLSSNRRITIPDDVAALIRAKTGRVCELSPHQITNYFARTCDRLGIGPYNFHALRHFGASLLLSDPSISMAYVQARGGWNNSQTLLGVYNHILKERQESENSRANELYQKCAKSVPSSEKHLENIISFPKNRSKVGDKPHFRHEKSPRVGETPELRADDGTRTREHP